MWKRSGGFCFGLRFYAAVLYAAVLYAVLMSAVMDGCSRERRYCVRTRLSRRRFAKGLLTAQERDAEEGMAFEVASCGILKKCA
jgi:hypothetical protein